jgi:hypothetical protein
VDAAEQAFDRAMAGAGGVGFARADADTINRVALRVARIDAVERRGEQVGVMAGDDAVGDRRRQP